MDTSYYGLSLIAFVARFIPMRFGYFLAERGGDILFLLSAKRRNTVWHNVQLALGAASDKRIIKRKVRNIFRNAVKNYFDLTKLSQMNFDNLDGKVRIEGMHHLTQAVNNGKGVIIASAHIGNFEFASHVLASNGIEMLILVETFDTNQLLRKIVALRQRKGIRILPVSISGIKEGIQTLRRGGTVLIVFDRDIQGNGIKVKFLGEQTSFPVGVVDLALRTGSTIIPIFSLRGPKNTTSLFIEPPLILSDKENRDQALRANLECLVGILEKYIRQYPDQWVVLEPV
jgi:lauroyl/myristoyl acyltransferase